MLPLSIIIESGREELQGKLKRTRRLRKRLEFCCQGDDGGWGLVCILTGETGLTGEPRPDPLTHTRELSGAPRPPTKRYGNTSISESTDY